MCNRTLFYREEWDACAVRETQEETGLHLKNVIFAKALNCIDLEEKYHYIEIFMQGEVDTNNVSEPKNLEPDKCEGIYCDSNWLKNSTYQMHPIFLNHTVEKYG